MILGFLFWFLVALVVSIWFGRLAVARRRQDAEAFQEYLKRFEP